MHILKIIHGYPPIYNAGSEVYSQTLCEALSEHHQVSVFTREENPYEPDFSIRKEVISPNLSLYRVNMPREKDGFQHPELDRRFEKLVIELEPDLAHLGHLNHLSTGIATVLEALSVPMVFTLHDFWLMCPRGQFLQVNFAQEIFMELCKGQEDQKCALKCYNRFFATTGNHVQDQAYWTSWIHRRMKATRDLCRKVDAFIAPSRYLQQRFIQDFELEGERVHYLDYGFDLARFRPAKKSVKRPFTFGYIGTHIPSKGIHQLIQAFEGIEGEAHLRIFGRPQGQSTPVLQNMAAACHLPVTFEGEYNNKTIAEKVFDEVDVIVVPSIWTENSPLVIHEAQACKVPVITADAGGMAEYVNHRVNGLLFKHRDPFSLRQQMQYALENPGFMRQLGSRGYLFHPQGKVPSIAKHIKGLTSLYQNILSHKLKKDESKTFQANH